MKNSLKLSNAIHILIYIELAKNQSSISSQEISESVSTNAGVIRRLMSQLSKAGLIHTKVGAAEPKLSRHPKNITMLDVFEAVEDTNLLKINDETNRTCPVGKNIQTVLANSYARVEKKAREEMQQITLEQLLNELMTEMDT